MILALDLQGVSQWLAFVTIILFLTSEVVSHFGPAHGLVLDKAFVRGMATICGVMLLIVIVILTYQALNP
jgi:uncharacterized membrane protein YecN with MAPEG domain